MSPSALADSSQPPPYSASAEGADKNWSSCRWQTGVVISPTVKLTSCHSHQQSYTVLECENATEIYIGFKFASELPLVVTVFVSKDSLTFPKDPCLRTSVFYKKNVCTLSGHIARGDQRTLYYLVSGRSPVG